MVGYNERGVIADNYHELQALSVIDAAQNSYPLPKASAISVIRAIFQAAEVALVNLTDVMLRAATDIEDSAIGSAVVKMHWVRGIHRVLVRLSMMPHQLGFPGRSEGVLRISDSPAFQSYLNALHQFDSSVKQCLESGALRLGTALEEWSLDNAEFNFLHLVRVSNHESTIWERNLAEVHVPTAVPAYEEIVVAKAMRDAVYDRELKGDTFFTQFRCLHQIPEILAGEVNDCIEQSIRDIRMNDLQQAAEQLSCVNVLMEGLLVSVPPMADNLATSDYHQIRENLGLTSGSHSIGLRYHLFSDLYEQLWEALASHATGKPVEDCSDQVIEEAIHRAERDRFHDSSAWMVHLLADNCLKLRASILQWRDQHMHLPRNNLGGEFTKSLTGSSDAVQAVKGMRDTALRKDCMLPLVRARGLANEHPLPTAGQMTSYLESLSSLDSQILVATGEVTKRHFIEVQERAGYFSQRCPFSVPPRRQV